MTPISGEMDGVERARARVRELTPLIFCFDLPIIPAVEANPDPNDPCVRAIQDQYNVQVYNQAELGCILKFFRRGHL